MELELYLNIEYTAGWYYWNFPGFYNINCFKILADFSQHPSTYRTEGAEESNETEQQEIEEEEWSN